MVNKFLFAILLIILLDTSVCKAEYDIEYPMIIQPMPISICFLSIVNDDNILSKKINFRKNIIHYLVETKDSILDIYTPNYSELKQIEKYGFHKSIDKKQITKRTLELEFWKRTNFNYVIFGSYIIDDDAKISVEIFLYNVDKMSYIMGTRWGFKIEEIDQVQKAIAQKIIETLKSEALGTLSNS